MRLFSPDLFRNFGIGGSLIGRVVSVSESAEIMMRFPLVVDAHNGGCKGRRTV